MLSGVPLWVIERRAASDLQRLAALRAAVYRFYLRLAATDFQRLAALRAAARRFAFLI